MATVVHFITYGNDKFTESKKRICDEAVSTDWFETITAYGPSDLNHRFKKKCKNVLKQKRGGGYWIWKPAVVKTKLDEINDNEFLVYLDAGCKINITENSTKRFYEYIDLLNKDVNNTGIISFENGYKERNWCIQEIFDYFKVNIKSKIATSQQIVGNTLIIKKNEQSIKQVNEWYNMAITKPLLFTDHYNKTNQQSYLKDNRHDQAIFSIIRKLNNPIMLPNETEWGKKKKESFQSDF